MHLRKSFADPQEQYFADDPLELAEAQQRVLACRLNNARNRSQQLFQITNRRQHHSLATGSPRSTRTRASHVSVWCTFAILTYIEDRTRPCDIGQLPMVRSYSKSHKFGSRRPEPDQP